MDTNSYGRRRRTFKSALDPSLDLLPLLFFSFYREEKVTEVREEKRWRERN